MPDLECRVLTSADDLMPVREAITQLSVNRHMLAASPFMLQALTESGESLFPGLCWFLCVDEYGPAALLPLRRMVEADSRLAPLSLTSVSRFEMLYADALVRPDVPPSAMASALLQTPVIGGRRADVVRLRNLPQDSQLLAIARALSAQCDVQEGTSVIAVGADAEAWRRGLSRNLRGQIKQSESRLRRTGPLAVRAPENATEMSEAFSRFVALEASGYKASRDALANVPGDRAILEGTLLGHAREGTAHLIELCVGDTLVASQFGVICGDRLYLIKIAFDERFAGASPGTFLMASLLQRLADEGRVKTVDCCVRQRWHARWHPLVEMYTTATIPNTGTPKGFALRAGRALRATLG
jgi:CelD/BcsL family acetyltransferase involved in cellulose biosynthesis